MSTPLAAACALAVLAAAGLVPVAAAVGRHWVAVPLAPLGGAVVAAGAATATVALGGPFLAWFAGLAVVAAACALWWRRSGHRPGRARPDGRTAAARWRVTGAVGAVAVAAACALSLRGLATPTVGFDARALWIMRAGWFLHDHHQLLVDLRLRQLVLTQSAYPPLVSAATAVAWGVTGVHTARLGVVVVAVLNACALAAAALAVVECGRRGAARLRPGRPPWVPAVAGLLAAVLVVLVAAGVTTPFLTNGYADPLWSLAAVGALSWGLQVPTGSPTGAATALLVLVAGLSKDEGVVIAAALVVLVAVRSVAALPTGDRRRRARLPLGVAAGELAVIGAWPVLMRIVGARGVASSFSSPSGFASRARATVDGMAPYLHVLVLAVPLAVVGGLLLAGTRRRAGLGHDGWAWAALAAGLVAVGGALVTGTGAIGPWILSTVHRVTEFPVLAAWWIVAAWGVVGAAAAVERTGRRGAVPVPVPPDAAGHAPTVPPPTDGRAPGDVVGARP